MYTLTFDLKVLSKKGLGSSNDTSIYNSSQLKNRMTSIVKPVLSGHSKRTPKTGFQYRLLLNVVQKYCRMLQGEHSAILSTFIKVPFSI